MEEELHRKLNEDCGKKLIYEMARERDEDSKDVIVGSVIKYKNGKLVTEWKYVLQVREDYYIGTVKPKETSELKLPSAGEGEVKLE